MEREIRKATKDLSHQKDFLINILCPKFTTKLQSSKYFLYQNSHSIQSSAPLQSSLLSTPLHKTTPTKKATPSTSSAQTHSSHPSTPHCRDPSPFRQTYTPCDNPSPTLIKDSKMPPPQNKRLRSPMQDSLGNRKKQEYIFNNGEDVC